MHPLGLTAGPPHLAASFVIRQRMAMSSAGGTFETSRNVRCLVAIGGKADVERATLTG
jgi:hypothetical protein